MTKIRAVLVALTSVLAIAACGESTGEKPLPTSPAESSVTSAPTTGSAPDTTAAPVETGRSCAAILSDGVELATDWRSAQRGIVAPDESEYRARAQVLLDEARSRSCPVPAAIEQFLGYETDGSVE